MKKWPIKRKRCRHWLRFHSWTFGLLLSAAPFVVLGDTPSEPPLEAGAFGLHPEVIKWVFNCTLGVAGFLLIRTLKQVDRSQNTLHSNQRELARALTQIITAHGINHNQIIEPPKLTGGDGE